MTESIDTTHAEPSARRAALPEAAGEQVSPPAPPTATPTPAAPQLAVPPAWTPNRISEHRGHQTYARTWFAPDSTPLARITQDWLEIHDGEARGDADLTPGTTVRAAYREAYRKLRLARHDAGELLKERASLQAQLNQALDKIASLFPPVIAHDAALLTNARRELEALKGRVAALEAERQPKPARDPGTAVLTLAYLRAWLTNAPLAEIQREGLEVLLALAQPWHARGRAWGRVLLSVQRLGIQVGITPEEASRGR